MNIPESSRRLDEKPSAKWVTAEKVVFFPVFYFEERFFSISLED